MRRSRRMVARRRDHPREYGENSWTTRYRQLLLGSSPRIRGEYRLGTPPYRANRIIPANTGRIIPVPGSLHYRRDHPREYGENSSTSRFHVSDGGSSPRIRGEYAVVVQSPVRVGIIPANTGRIHRIGHPTIRGGDHPREYGENNAISFDAAGPMGSSPRIRGEWRIDAMISVSGRIIPANTGRMLADIIGLTPSGGSSPRIRGELVACAYKTQCMGIIPANTGRMSRRYQAWQG